MGNAGYGNHTETDGAPDRPGAGQKPQPAQGTKDEQVKPAGPHADPSLTNEDATPGAGTLTPPGEHNDVDSTSG